MDYTREERREAPRMDERPGVIGVVAKGPAQRMLEELHTRYETLATTR